MGTIPDVLAAADAGEVDLGFVAIENSIEGTVNVTLDTLAFEHDLLIQREVVLGIQLNLLAPPGRRRSATSSGCSRSRSPTASAGRFLAQRAARRRGGGGQLHRRGGPARRRGGRRPLGRHRPALAAEIYGLDVLASDIEDHPENATRFVLVGRRTSSRRRPATTRRRSSCSSGPTGRAPCSRSSRSSRPAAINLDQARVPAHQEGPRRLLLHHRPRGPHRRRARGRLPARPALQGRRREVPRQLPGRRRPRPGGPPRRRGGLAARRRVDRRRRGPSCPTRTASNVRRRSGGRVDEGNGLENRRPARVRGFESHPLRGVPALGIHSHDRPARCPGDRAERVGFEPTDEVALVTALAGPRDKPDSATSPSGYRSSDLRRYSAGALDRCQPGP